MYFILFFIFSKCGDIWGVFMPPKLQSECRIKGIKAARSDEWALTVLMCQSMLLSMHAAIGLVHATPSIEEVVPLSICQY